jgi:kumamolisin
MPWYVTPNVIDSTNSQPSHSGLWKAWLSGYGAVHTDTLYQEVSIPLGATAATLSFWQHIETSEKTTTTAYDTLKIQVRSSSGLVLGTLATFSNLNARSGYTQVSYDLRSYKGQTIQIYLIGAEDSSLPTSFVIDDFALIVTTP